jgi:hypothetical protein
MRPPVHWRLFIYDALMPLFLRPIGPLDYSVLEDGKRIGRNGCGVGFFLPLALLLVLKGLSRGPVFCLRHAGMIAPIPPVGKPLGFEAGRPGTASCWSIDNSTRCTASKPVTSGENRDAAKKPQAFTRRGSPGSKIDAYEIVQPR